MFLSETVEKRGHNFLLELTTIVVDEEYKMKSWLVPDGRRVSGAYYNENYIHSCNVQDYTSSNNHEYFLVLEKLSEIIRLHREQNEYKTLSGNDCPGVCKK